MKILLVEDNPAYIGVAMKTLSEHGNTVLHSSDFDSANSINYQQYSAALVDCFFPEKFGTGRTDIGRKVIEKITNKGLHEILEKDIAELKDIADMTIPAVNDYFRGMLLGAYSIGLDVKRLLPLEAMKYVSKTIGQEVATLIAQQEPLLSRYRTESKRDYFKSMSDYLDKGEANQPLGIALADNLAFADKPFLLCTSTYHHDNVTQPIQNYTSKMGWTLLDCQKGKPEEKSTQEYWTNAFKVLKYKIDGGAFK